MSWLFATSHSALGRSSIFADYIGIVWPTGEPDGEPVLDDNLDNLRRSWRWIFLPFLSVIPNDAMLCMQLLERRSYRIHARRSAVYCDASILEYRDPQYWWIFVHRVWLALRTRETKGR